MRSWPMLRLRGSTWHYQRAVPLELQALAGRKAIWKSLRTSDFAQAKLLSLRVGQEVEREFQTLRKRLTTVRTNPDALARLYESRALTDDLEARQTRTPTEEEDAEGAAEAEAEVLDIELDALTRAIEDHGTALRTSDTGVVAALLDELLTEQGIHVPPGRRRDFALAVESH